ncbi:MAG: trimeric intracellular cation channel family protein [Bryobacterales bacterium]|nr:trimeric intracellular cation channel family protein [Bryobacterales bacterium]
MVLIHPGETVIMSMLFQAFDLGGTFVFAISGAIAGVRHKLDLFGVLVLSFAAATFGGITRDVLIGAIPPASVADWRYLAVSLLAGMLTFFFYSKVSRFRNALLIYDAAGLGLFAVTGAAKALAYQLGPIPAALLGTVTGIGGGVVRDVLVSEVPAVFRTEVYAVAALIGSCVVVIGSLAGLPPGPVAAAGAFLCFTIRMLAIRRGWHFPVAKLPDERHG